MQRIESETEPGSIQQLSVPPSKWREDPFVSQLAKSALGQFGLLDRVSTDSFVELASGLVIANGDEELQIDVYDNFASKYGDILTCDALRGAFEQALEWFERASRIDPLAGQDQIDTEDRFSCIGTAENGSHVDFRNPVKEKWRDCWGSWLEALSHPEDRAHMKVLCMPSPQVWPEVRHYLERGFKASNIYAVEGGDREARRVFADNCRRYGINPVIGRLENVVPKLEHEFSVALLDLLGPMSTKLHDILQGIKLADRAFVGLNTMAARESRTTQESLRWVTGPGAFSLKTVNDFIGSLPEISPALNVIRDESARRTELLTSGPKFSDVRDIMAPFVVAGSSARDAEINPIQSSINRVAARLGINPTEDEVSRIQSSAMELVVDLSLESLDLLPEDAYALSVSVKSLLAGQILSYFGFDRQPLVIQNFGYYSQVSEKQIPYHSSFVMSQRSRNSGLTDDSISTQILDFILDQVVEGYVTKSDSVRIASGIERGNKPSLIFASANGNYIRISLETLNSEIQRYLDSARARLSVVRDCPELIMPTDRIWLNSRTEKS